MFWKTQDDTERLWLVIALVQWRYRIEVIIELSSKNCRWWISHCYFRKLVIGEIFIELKLSNNSIESEESKIWRKNGFCRLLWYNNYFTCFNLCYSGITWICWDDWFRQSSIQYYWTYYFGLCCGRLCLAVLFKWSKMEVYTWKYLWLVSYPPLNAISVFRLGRIFPLARLTKLLETDSFYLE